jgi:GT2 family glycosyltransferase
MTIIDSMKKSKTLKSLLETAFFGRLSRKILFLSLRISRRCIHLSTKAAIFFGEAYGSLPYIRLIAPKLDPDRIAVLSKYYEYLSHIVQEFPYKPTISVIVPVYKVSPEYLRECLQSVASQVYKNWELCIVDDCSNEPALDALIISFVKKYPGKVRYSKNPQNSHISITSNNALRIATGEYVALLDHDDRIYPNALAEVIRYINLHDSPDVLYSDERHIDDAGHPRNETFRKPGWSPFFHLSVNYTTHLTVYKKSIVDAVGGFRAGFEGSQDHDLMLRVAEITKKPIVHIPFCLYQWRAHLGSTAASLDSKPYAAIAGEKAVSEALERRGRPAEVSFEPRTGHYRLKFKLPSDLPLISIVIPSRNSFDLISSCLESIFEKTTYPSFEIIIVDNGTSDQRVINLYDSYQAKGVTVIRNEAYFNFAKMNNIGIRAARGQYTVLLNNDTTVISPAWLEELLGLAQHPEVGAVGAKLLYPNNTIQSAGIVMKGHMIAENKGGRLQDEHWLYNHIMNTVHEVSGVTGACFMIATHKYWEVGGLDEKFAPNGFGDVDFCLQLLRHGYVNVYTPYAKLYHHESPSRGLIVEYFEQYYLTQKFPKELMNDPYLNPNLKKNSLYQIEPAFEALDLNASEFQYFLEALDRPEPKTASSLGCTSINHARETNAHGV